MVETVDSILPEEWVVGEWVSVRGDCEGVQGGGEEGQTVQLVQCAQVGALKAE